MVFMGEAHSQAALKRPATGEFRVQHEFGGSAELRQPLEAVLDGARSVLRAIDGSTAYLRVVGVLQDGRFVLMEAEAIEPDLFLRMRPEAADSLARWVVARIDETS